jgi:hypothetical protein
VRLLLLLLALLVDRHAISVPRHCHRCSSCVDTAVATYLVFFILNVLERSLRRCCNLRGLSAAEDGLVKNRITHLVFEHKDIVMIHKVFVNILKSPACCLWIEEVNEWHECSVEHSPDDVEFPTERADTNGRDLNHYEITCGTLSASILNERSRNYLLHSQLVAVPSAAPLDFIDNELISG